MQPTCYLLGSAKGETVLYLEQVSTLECLELLPEADPVSLIEFGATRPDGSWIDLTLSVDAIVSELIGRLKEISESSIFSFAAKVGSIRLSTHDDGEADFRFPSQAEALTLLRKALPPELSTEVIPRLLESPGRYVTMHEGSWKSFSTFDDYLIWDFAVRED